MSKPTPRSVEVVPGGVTRAAAGPGIVVILLFLVFGAGFMGIVFSETPNSEPLPQLLIGGFGVIWVIACLAILRVYVRIWRVGRNASPDSLLAIETTTEGETPLAARRLRRPPAQGWIPAPRRPSFGRGIPA